MNILIKSLATLFTLLLLTGAAVQSVQAAAWIEHKFVLQLPDGKTKDLKGAKMHIFHKQHEAGGATAFINNCYYPEKSPINENDEWAANVKAGMESSNKGYHCATPSSCSVVDYGAPYLPYDFNEDVEIYDQGNTSYKTFYGKTLSQALSSDQPFAYLANAYERGNIRGFKNARWQGSVDYTATDSRGPVSFASQDEINTLNSNQYWGANLPKFQGKQSWNTGEVFRDPQGVNVLHAQITWVLKAPSPVTKPTATFSGVCQSSDDNGIGRYEYKIDNIDLKGQPFSYSRIFLDFVGSAQTRKVREFLGTPSYGPDNPADGQSFGYYMTMYRTQPANGYASLYTANSRVGDTPTSKTLGELVAFLDAQRAANPNSVPATFTIKLNLATLTDGNSNLNDSILTNPAFNPKFTKYECGGAPPPTGGGIIPACVGIKMLNGDNVQVTNPSALKPGDNVKFECTKVTNVNKYAFKVTTFDAQGAQTGTSTNLNPESEFSNRSSLFTIPSNGGRFTAQCALCNNDGGDCRFEVTNYNGSSPTGGSTSTACASPNSCVTSAGCLTVASGNFSCPVSGQVCCANRRRDE